MATEREQTTFDLQETRRTLPIALLRAREAVMEHFRPMLSAQDVSEQQWRVMRVLHESGESDAKSVAEGACILAPSLTRMLRTLEARDFGQVRKDPDDGRRTLIRLTGTGETFLREVAPQSAEIYAGIEASIGRERIDRLLDELEQFLAAMKGAKR